MLLPAKSMRWVVLGGHRAADGSEQNHSYLMIVDKSRQILYFFDSCPDTLDLAKQQSSMLLRVRQEWTARISSQVPPPERAINMICYKQTDQ
jgi:hypothetical protein